MPNLVWSGHDAEGNTVSGTLTVPVVPASVSPPASIAADGSVDVAAALTSWLAAVPDYTTIDLSGRTYWMDTPLKLTGRKGLTFLGGTFLRKGHGGLAWPTVNAHVWLVKCDDMTIGVPGQGLTIVSTNTVADQKPLYGSYLQAYEFEAGVRAEGCKNLKVHAELFDAIWGDGVQLQPSGTGVANYVHCDGFRITGHMDRVGRQGVTPVGINGYVSVSVDHPRRSLIDLEPAAATWQCHDILIEGCTGAPIGLPISALGSGAVNNVTIQDCTFSGGSVPKIQVGASDGTRRSNWVFRRNTTIGQAGSPSAMVKFTKVDGVVVEDNVLPVIASQSRRAAEFVSCGGSVAFRRNNMSPGGLYIDWTTPAAGATTDFSGNTPTLTVRAT